MAAASEGLGALGQAAWQFLTDEDAEARDSADGTQIRCPIIVNFSAHLRGGSSEPSFFSPARIECRYSDLMLAQVLNPSL